jgi:UDP-N-acetylmuramoylalanine-D-glutamate ligase
MSIQSHAFGRVTLTGEDARKFKRQISHGKPKKAAVETVKRGVALARDFESRGRLTLVAPATRRGRR